MFLCSLYILGWNHNCTKMFEIMWGKWKVFRFIITAVEVEWHGYVVKGLNQYV